MRTEDICVSVFKYDKEKDAFTLDPSYMMIAGKLGLGEWNPVVWIGRLFCMDNDFGEHWFDNWDLMEERGLDSDTYFVLDENRFKDGHDGPCHSDKVRRIFWTDVLKSFTISLGMMIQLAREDNEHWKEILDGESEGMVELAKDIYMPDLEECIKKVLGELG